MELFVYPLNVFIPVDLTLKEVVDSFRESELKPFELVREVVEKDGVKNVKLLGSFIQENEFQIGYLAEFSSGQIAVKILCTDDPQKLLKEYYRKIAAV